MRASRLDGRQFRAPFLSMASGFARGTARRAGRFAERNSGWDSGFPGWGGHAVVAALVVATNLAPTAGLDGLADYTGAAACALATGSDMQDSACRAGTQATDRAAADTATESAATTGHDPAYRGHRHGAHGRGRRPTPGGLPEHLAGARRPGRRRRRRGQLGGYRNPVTTTTVDEARDEDGGSDRRRRDTHADDTDDAGDGPAPRHPPVVHERDDDEQDSSGDDADTPGPALRAAAAPARVPGDLIDLADWYLTLPTGKPGDPDTVENPDLEKFTNAFFTLNDARDGVVFSAHGDGVTTKNSHYPRSELREMNGSAKAAWSNTSGRHTLDVCEAITQVPSAKPEVVAAQIHDDKDDVLQIRLEGQKLMRPVRRRQVRAGPRPGLPARHPVPRADRRRRHHGRRPLQRREESRTAAHRLRLVLEGRRLRPGQLRHRRCPEHRRGDRVRAAGQPLRHRRRAYRRRGDEQRHRANVELPRGG